MNEPLSLWERGWGEGINQLKNRNFDSSTTSPTPSPLRASPCGEGGYLNCQHALGRVYNLNLPPLRSGGGAGRGCENHVATAFKTKCKQPIAHRLPSNTTTAARPPADLPPPLWGRVRVGFAYIPPMQNRPPFCSLPRGGGLEWEQQKNAQRPNPIKRPHLHTPRALKRM